MALGDLFRPKYKHSDAAVRAEAIQNMGGEHLGELVEVATTDPDDGVRKLAIERIGDPEALLSLSEEQDDRSLAELARGRAYETWASKVKSTQLEEREALAVLARIDDARYLAEVAARAERKVIRSTALMRLSDDRARASVVRLAQDDEEWRAALSRIQDADVLRGIAVDENRKAVAIAAIEAIEDEDTLEHIQRKAKSKGARNFAKKRRANLRQTTSAAPARVDPEKLAHAERVQIVRVIEKRSKGNEWKRSHGEVTEATRRWAELGEGSDRSLVARYEKARKRYFDNYERYAAAEAVAAERAEKQPAAPGEPTSLAEGTAPQVLEEDAAAERKPSGATPPAEESEAEADVDPDVKVPSKQDREANVSALRELVEAMQGLASADRLKGFERRVKDLLTARHKVGPVGRDAEELKERFEEAHRAAKIRLGELREAEEWKRWAAVPMMEKLVAEAKQLLEDADDTEQLPSALKGLQRRWRDVGAGPREKSEELWAVFKETCDRIYDRVKAQRAALTEVQKENLRRKVELCEQAEELSTSDDWQGTAEALKKLQHDWKMVGPVAPKKADQVWKRFRAACDEFFERRRPHVEERVAERQENLEAKESIVLQIEELAKSDLEAGEAIRRVKPLQREWRDIGPVPHKDFEALGARFKEACDAVYGKREAEARVEREAREAERREVEGKLDAAEAATEPDEVKTAVLEARAAVLAFADADKELVRRLDGCVQRAVENQPAAFRDTELDPEVSRSRKRKLCEKIEELCAEADESTPDLSDAEAMAAKLRAAMADNALGGVLAKASPEAVAELVADARASWARLGPVPGAEGAELEARFAAACERARSKA